MTIHTKRLAELLKKESKGTKVLTVGEQNELYNLLERMEVDITTTRKTVNETIITTLNKFDVKTIGTLDFLSPGTIDLDSNTLTMGADLTTTGSNLTLTASGAYTLTVAGSATIGGSGALTLTTNLTNQGGAGVLAWPAGGATLTVGATSSISGNIVVAADKTLTCNNSLTIYGNDGALVEFSLDYFNVTRGDGYTYWDMQDGACTLSIYDGTSMAWFTSLTNQGGAGKLTWPVAGATLTIPATGTTALGAGTATVTSTNAYSTNTHTHAVTTSAAVTDATQVILATDTNGLLQLYRLGIGTACGSQYDLDVAGSIHTSSYFVGPHALEVEGALMLCHYDGERPWETNFTGEVTGHMGQVGTVTGGLIFRPGTYYKGAQFGEAATNLITNPSIETATTLWTADSNCTVSQSSTQAKYGTYSLKTITSGANAGIISGYVTVSASTSHCFSINIYVDSVGDTFRIGWYEYNAASTLLGYSSTVTDYTPSTTGWMTISNISTTAGTCAKVKLRVYNMDTSHTYYFDGFQLVASAYRIPYLDGSLGTGHTWSGTAHASTSARTAAVLSYTNPLIAAEACVALWWTPSSANTTAQATPYLFSEGNIKAYFQASDDKIYFTDGTNTISTAALTFSADANQFLCFSWSSAGLAIQRYYNSTMDTTVTGATYTAPALGANLFIGSDTSSANQNNGIIDELIILDHAMTDAEFLAIAKSNAPVFAATSTWSFRFGYSKGWADIDGLWVKDFAGNATFGAFGGQASTSTKSWGGFTMSPGDIILGHNLASMSAIQWDQSTGKFGFYGNANATVQCEIDTTGALTAGGGVVKLDSDGIVVSAAGAYANSRAYKFSDTGGTAGLYAYSDNIKTEITGAASVVNNIRAISTIGETSASIILYSYHDDDGAGTNMSTATMTLRATGGGSYVVIDVKSTTGLLVEQNGVKDNVLVVDTVNARVGIDCTPTVGFEVATDTKISGYLKVDDNSTTALVVEQDGVKDNVLVVDTTNAAVSMAATAKVNYNSTTALLVEQDGVKDNVLVVDTTNGAIGLNTSAVSGVTLTVNGAIQYYTSGLIYGRANDEGYVAVCGGHDGASGGVVLVYGDTHATLANVIQFKTGAGTEIARFLSDGKLGLGGDTAPAEMLDVTGNINATGVIKIDDVQVVGNRVVNSTFTNDADDVYGAVEKNLINGLVDALIAHGLIAAA